jgi:hypothetical protein
MTIQKVRNTTYKLQVHENIECHRQIQRSPLTVIMVNVIYFSKISKVHLVFLWAVAQRVCSFNAVTWLLLQLGLEVIHEVAT